MYSSGGYHLTHIRDCFYGSRYETVHKPRLPAILDRVVGKGPSGNQICCPGDHCAMHLAGEQGGKNITFPHIGQTGSTNSPEHCDIVPLHLMQDIESYPLYLNPDLESPAVCLTRGLFCHFATADEIVALESPAGEEYELALCPSSYN